MNSDLVPKLIRLNLFKLLSSKFFAGVFSSEATPVPIPNTEVKLTSGDGIAGLTLWESSTTPALFFVARLGN